MAYKITFSPLAARQLRKLTKEVKVDVDKLVDSLSTDPRPRGCKNLKDRPGYRVRTKNFRVIYLIHDNILTVCVLTVADRKDAYD